jgi:isoquinoline 1-oxidoreductase beta subunit
MLLSAAAAEWGVDARTLKVENGVIVSPRLKKLSFGEVAAIATKALSCRISTVGSAYQDGLS